MVKIYLKVFRIEKYGKNAIKSFAIYSSRKLIDEVDYKLSGGYYYRAH